MDGVRLEEIVEASLSVVFHLAKEGGNRGLIRDVAVIRLLKRILSCGPPPGQSQAGENIIRYVHMMISQSWVRCFLQSIFYVLANTEMIDDRKN